MKLMQDEKQDEKQDELFGEIKQLCGPAIRFPVDTASLKKILPRAFCTGPIDMRQSINDEKFEKSLAKFTEHLIDFSQELIEFLERNGGNSAEVMFLMSLLDSVARFANSSADEQEKIKESLGRILQWGGLGVRL